MNQDQIKKDVLNKALMRVFRLFEYGDNIDSKKDYPFVHTKFDWAPESNLHTEVSGVKRRPHFLMNIYEDIANDLENFEHNIYAREAQDQHYIERAWKSVEQYRQAKDYFTNKGIHAFPAGAAYDQENCMLNIHASIMFSETFDPREAQEIIDSIKKSLMQFESYMELYKGALDYRLRPINSVMDYIKSSLRYEKGAFPKDSKNPISDVLSTTVQEDALSDLIRQHLRSNELDDPFIMDTVRAATAKGIHPTGFLPRPMYDFFKTIRDNITCNSQSCEAIIKLSQDTREHIDRIVRQENRKAGIEI